MICVDSDFIIDFLKGRTSAVAVAEQHRTELITTEINRFEVLFGIFMNRAKGKITESHASAAREFFDSIDVLPFNQGCGEAAAHLLTNLAKGGAMINQNDVLVAAILSRNGCSKIVTRNAKDFMKTRGITVVAY